MFLFLGGNDPQAEALRVAGRNKGAVKMLKNLFLGATALSLSTSPVLAQTSGLPAPQPAAEELAGSQLRAPGSPFAPLLFTVIIVLGVLLAFEEFPFEDDDGPAVSP